MLTKRAENSTLRLVATTQDAEEVLKVGRRLAALRNQCGLTQDQVVAMSEPIARRLGPGYEPIERTALSHMERGKAKLHFDRTRAVLANVFDLNRDQFADYLDGKLSVDQVMALRESRRVADSSPPSAQHPGAPRYGDHPRWASLCEDALRIDPELRPETLRDLAVAPFAHAPLDRLDAMFVVQVARALQGWNARQRSRM